MILCVHSHSFGSLVRSKTSGIIFNDEMDDFSIPGRDSDDSLKATEPNYIKPGKRPLSSTTPTIMLGEGGSVQMVVGGSGGSRITTAVAQVHLLPLSSLVVSFVTLGPLAHTVI